ncbi:MAG TPA: helix-turn-helix transcriptional regulator [Usitatibacter sp.]|nr:helix-turn-helix transcriptional regulator [Usitatibacter sp.]
MDLKIDSQGVRNERRKRGWSQEQLAAAAGLGLRTIQRLESSGIASGESAKCLAAVFEVSVAQLLVAEPAPGPSRKRVWPAAVTAVAVLASTVFAMSRASATDVAMQVFLTTGVTGKSRMNIEVASGRQTEIKLEKDVRLLLTPTIRKDGTILVSTEVYGWDGGEFRIAGKPRILLRQGSDTGLQLSLGGDRSATIRITAREL